jgi:glycosyltransferase involved in cell wall biosynthesis
MVEQIACGRPIVSTDVSGVRELVVDGKNGFILPSRDVKLYAQRMLDVLNLAGAEQFSRDLAVKEFSTESLCTRLKKLWAPFASVSAGIESGNR